MANEAARLRGISHSNRPDPGPPPATPSVAEEQAAADADMTAHLAVLEAAAGEGRNRAVLEISHSRKDYIERVASNLEAEGFTVRRHGRMIVRW